ncbi:MAG TPA: hypothetical protein VFP49_11715, partial [Nitrososphaeraceae archaeon]|nr:hypothetical protein [Nitrososphaeraceae archaeon]
DQKRSYVSVWSWIQRFAEYPIYKRKLKHYLHSPFQKSLMERVNQYFKDRTENFDDYYPCMQDGCNLFHVHNWIQFFVSMYNDTITNNNNDFELEEVNILLN